MAQRIYRNAVEQGKPDKERKQGYQERDQERISNGIKRMDYSFDTRVDEAIFLDRLSSYSNFEIEEGTRSPGWIRYQKRIK